MRLADERGYLYVGLFALLLILCAVVLAKVALGQVSACGGVSGTSACRPTFATVASLPACNAGVQGTMYMVNDANAPTALATVAGSGAVHVGVLCNGSAWIVQ